MDALRQRPLLAALATTSPTANQIRETCATVREHLRAAPDDLTALILCEVLVDLAPTRDLELVAHRDRFCATRADDWREQGRVRGIHRLLFHLADGARGARLDAALVSALEGRAVELSESRPAGVPPGHIDASLVPAVLAADAGFHPDGHLAQVRVDRGAGRQGQLRLGPRPGAGTFFLEQKHGEYGSRVEERYRRGCVETTLRSPWHDGDQDQQPAPWTRWVLACLDRLEALAQATPPRRARAARRTGLRGQPRGGASRSRRRR